MYGLEILLMVRQHFLSVIWKKPTIYVAIH